MGATFPQAIKIFQVFHDYTDVIWAWSVNEIHDEVVAIEKLLGTGPFQGTPYTTFAGAIADLWANKAPSNHTHIHSTLMNDAVGNDHPQYIEVTGYPGFSRPVAGQNAIAGNHLLPLAQLQAMGYQNAAQVQAAVNAALGNLMSGAPGGPPVAGPATTPNWKVQGGIHSGCTDPNDGHLDVPFGTAMGTVQAFVCTKLPPQGGGACPPYNWIEAQVTLMWCSGTMARVQFSHDYSWQQNMYVSLSWIAIGR